MEPSAKILSDIIVYSKYARYLEKENRRETWNEIITRNLEMHIRKFPFLEEEIRENYKLVFEKKVLPSMRSCQFAGKPIDVAPQRMFNCSAIAINDWRAFSEMIFLLLLGCGVGYSVQKHHVEQLPSIRKPLKRKKRYLIPDSIEGWSEAVKMLTKSYFFGTSDIEFDYSDIREKGQALITSGGKAPGSQPLKDCIHNLKKVLDEVRDGDKLTPFQAHEMACYISDSVLSGGIRRCLPKDSLIYTKEGIKRIQFIKKGEIIVTGKNKSNIVKDVWYTGKKKIFTIKTMIGNLYSSEDHRWAILKDLDGHVDWKSAKDLSSDDTLVIIPEILEGRETKLPSWEYNKPLHSTTCKDIKIPELDEGIAWFLGQLHGDGYVYVNNNRNKVDSNSFISIACDDKIEEQKEKNKIQIVKFGLVSKEVKNKNEKCTRVLVSSKQLAVYLSQFKKPNISIDVPDCILESFPNIRASYVGGLFDADGCCCVHKDHYNVNFSIVSIYEKYLLQIQTILMSLGIYSKVILSRKAKENWKNLYKLSILPSSKPRFVSCVEPYSIKIKKYFNGKYTNENKIRYDFTIPSNLLRESKYCKLFDNIYSGENNSNLTFVKFQKILQRNIDFIPLKILEVIYENVEEDTYDISVEGDACLINNGVLTHNSACLSLFSVDDEEMLMCKNGDWWDKKPHLARANNTCMLIRHKISQGIFSSIWKTIKNNGTGEPAFDLSNDSEYLLNPCGEASLKISNDGCGQFCNLTEINMDTIEDQQDLDNRAKVASFLGTLQASYTNFHYLRDRWKRNTEKDALLGVSLNGIANKKIYKLDLKKAARVVLEENARVSNLIGINKASRSTVIKPSGTSSLVLGCSSGIHSWFAQYYIRRVRLNKEEVIYKYLKEKFSFLIEEDLEKPFIGAILSIPIKAPDSAIVRKDESAIEFLERVKYIYENWIKPGHRVGSNTHSVSCTVNLKDNEWEDVEKWLWENKEYYNCISFLPYDNNTYHQMPFESCTKEKYEELMQYLTQIDLSQISEEEDKTNLQGEMACSGGSCAITHL